MMSALDCACISSIRSASDTLLSQIFFSSALLIWPWDLGLESNTRTLVFLIKGILGDIRIVVGLPIQKLFYW